MAALLSFLSFPIEDYNWGGSEGELWLYCNQTWTDALGVIHLASDAFSKLPYQRCPFTVAGRTATVLDFLTPSTVDSNKPRVRIAATIVDSLGQERDTLFENAQFPATPNPITKLEFDAFNAARSVCLDDKYLTREEIFLLFGPSTSRPIATGMGTLLVDESTTILSGLTKVNSPIEIIPASDGITGRPYGFKRVEGVSFDVTSDNGADAGDFRWFLYS